MSTETNSPGNFLLIFRGTDWHKGLSPEQMQHVATQWRNWFDRLTREGKALAGNPLENTGKILSGKNGQLVSDGPFSESKEAIGGYFLLQVGSEAEALGIARQCPGLPHGAVVEVRPIAAACPMSHEAPVEAEVASVAA